jgi:hypothetical protein
MPAPKPEPDPGERYTWKKGDLVLLKPGEGEPLISEEELDRILRENSADQKLPERSAPARPRGRQSPTGGTVPASTALATR